MNTMYSLVLEAINGLAIGDSNTIPVPDNITYFRKYLSEISKREGKKFTTKVTGDQMQVFRIKYSNIYSKEIE